MNERENTIEENLGRIIEQIKEGDTQVFGEFYEKTYRHLSFYLLQYTQNEQEIEDVLQETYLEVHKKLDTLQREKAVMGWMRTIARNKWIDSSRKDRFSFVSYDANEEILDIEEDNQELLPEVKANAEECNRLLKGILEDLNETQRMVIVEFYYNDRTIKDIAGEMQVSEGTIKSALYRTKAIIKDKVVELDKKYGTRIYSVNVVPLLFAFFQTEEANFMLSKSCIGLGAKCVYNILEKSIKPMITSQAETAQMVAHQAKLSIIKNMGGKIGAMAVKSKIIAGVVAGVVVVSSVGGIVYANKDILFPKKEVPVVKTQVVEDMDATTLNKKEEKKLSIELVSNEIKLGKGIAVNAGEIIKSIQAEKGIATVVFSAGEILESTTEPITFDANGVPSSKLKYDTLGEQEITITVTDNDNEEATTKVMIDVVELETFVIGLQDWSVELGTTVVLDFMKDIAFDLKYIKGITCDSAQVNPLKTGTYELIYTIEAIDASKVNVLRNVVVGENVVASGEGVAPKEKVKKDNNTQFADKSNGDLFASNDGKQPNSGNNSTIANNVIPKPEAPKTEVKPEAPAPAPKPETPAPTPKPETPAPTPKPETPAPTPKPEPKPEQPPVHSHAWNPVNATKWVETKAAWTETLYKEVPKYEEKEVWGALDVCNVCGWTTEVWDEMSEHQVDHMLNDNISGYHTEEYIIRIDKVQVGTEKVVDKTVNHPAEGYNENYVTGYACGCGATK